MSSIAGPSSHAFSSFPIHPKQPPAISTQLRRVQDASEPPSATNGRGPATPTSAIPAMTAAGTPSMTAPPTPRMRSVSASGATGTPIDGREMSVDVAGSVSGRGMSEVPPQPPGRGPVPKESVAADMEKVKARTLALSRKHGREEDEEEAMVQTAARIAARLAEDQRAALFPDVDEPFEDELDAVKRLLPFHVFQQPQEDLDVLLQCGSLRTSLKGKRKATEEDLLKEEIADTKFALDCWRRRRALERRFRKARIGPGKRTSPDDQGYVLAQAVLEAERAENSALNTELRSARAELDKIEREKRAAAPPPAPAPKPAPTIRTSMSTGTNYYSSSTTSTPTTATFMPPYRPPYSYTYSQYPSTQYTYNPYSAYTPSTPYGSTAPQTPATPTTTYNPPVAAASATPTSSASAQVQQAQVSSAISSTAIPVQLPVSSLPALGSLGIVPVPAASLPPAGQPQPPAVIKSTNGNMLSLEINLSMLQSAQMSGLVLILNALTSTGVNVDGSISVATARNAGSANGSNGAAASASQAGLTATSAASSGSGAVPPGSSTSSGSTSPTSAAAT